MESRFFSVAAVLLVLGLIASVFVVSPVYTWSEVCSACGGTGAYSCRECGGSGECWVCDGAGSIWYMLPGDNWCAACQGSGRCYVCGGDGVATCKTCYGRGSVGHWAYSLSGAFVLLSVFDAFFFLFSFVLQYAFDAFYLGFNMWVNEVSDMGFWFNRSFFIWLFAKNRKRWAKWACGFSAYGAVYLGALLFWSFVRNNISGGVLLGAFLLSAFPTSFFAWLFYKYYISRKSKTPTLDYEPM